MQVASQIVSSSSRITDRSPFCGRRSALAGALVASALTLIALSGCGASRGGDENSKGSGGVAEIGKAAPNFTLHDTDGSEHRLSDYSKAGKLVVLEWFNPDCPFIKKHHVNSRSMADLYSEQKGKNVVWLAINSGAPGKQGAGLERNKQAKIDYGMEYPILIDESGAVGRMYGAKTTPHMFVIAPNGKLIYKGAFDDDPSPGTVGETLYVRAAVDRFIGGDAVVPSETTSYGCSVKYAGP